MSKRIINYLCAASVLFVLASCKKNNVAVDRDPLIPPEAARFLGTSSSGILWIAPAGSTYKIPIGVTTVSSSDRVIQLTYTSPTGAVKGTHYNAPASITIPAGKTIDSVTIQAFFAPFTPNNPHIVNVAIATGTVKANAYNNTFSLTLGVPCPVVFANLQGDFDNTNEYLSSGEFSYGPYTTTLYGLTALTSTSAKGFISNIYDAGWNDIEATFTYTTADPTFWTVTIAKQATGRNSGGKPYYVRTSPGQVSTFNSCDNSISLTIDLVGGASGNDILDQNYQIVLQK